MGRVRQILGLEVGPAFDETTGEELIWVCPGTEADPGAHELTGRQVEEGDPGFCPIHQIDLFPEDEADDEEPPA